MIHYADWREGFSGLTVADGAGDVAAAGGLAARFGLFCRFAVSH